MFGICNLSVVPCRREPSDKSEMVTQLLFGETFEIIEIQGNWVHIKIAFDDYNCWIDKKQYLPIEQHTFDIINSTEAYHCNELIQVVTDLKSKQLFPITIGSNLPNFDNAECAVENTTFNYDGAFVNGYLPFTKSGIVDSAMLFLNAPYLWGGKTPFGIDCSGFTQTVYKLNGIKLLRDAYQQAEQGETLSFVEEAEAGDLAFFDNEEGRIVHVGIVLDNNKIIHASGKVRIDGFDHHGIFNNEKRDYSHKLRLLKRIV
ncbi:MAG: C40 family peptidase [Bacteroidetes bacterium]|nr:C40 family peptidase [Bacteroidota bacterium]